MKQSLVGLPGFKKYEYVLILNPHEDLRNKIQKVKKEFADSYQNNMAVFSKPYLPLVNFVQLEMAEERIINRLKNIAMGFPPVKIELKDFGSFPTHSIFIQVTTKQSIQNLVKSVRTEAQQLMKLDADHKPYFSIEPHFTIARKLQPWQFEKGWLAYSHKHFTGRFIADAMLLLKREMGTKNYQIAHRFEFQNLPVAITQGQLF